MPCLGDGYAPDPQRDVDRMTRLLCEAYGIIKEQGGLKAVSSDGMSWLEAHTEWDKERKRRERRDELQKRLDGLERALSTAIDEGHDTKEISSKIRWVKKEMAR